LHSSRRLSYRVDHPHVGFSYRARDAAESRPSKRRLGLAVAAALGLSTCLGGVAHAAFADTGHAVTGSAGSATPTVAAILATAERYLGYPYATIGDSPSTGFSCIGFVHFVFAQNGVNVPGTLGAAFASAPKVDQSHLQPGDLVFFQNTGRRGISHVDIYIGDGKMIGADSFQTGVRWDTLSDSYWQQHYLGATRPLAAGGAPTVSATPTQAPAASATTAPPTATPVTSDTPSPSATMAATTTVVPEQSNGIAPHSSRGCG